MAAEQVDVSSSTTPVDRFHRQTSALKVRAPKSLQDARTSPAFRVRPDESAADIVQRLTGRRAPGEKAPWRVRRGPDTRPDTGLSAGHGV